MIGCTDFGDLVERFCAVEENVVSTSCWVAGECWYGCGSNGDGDGGGWSGAIVYGGLDRSGLMFHRR